MVLVQSSLGSFLRWDREDFTKERRDAASFVDAREADEWIVANYGRNGLKFFFTRTVLWRQDDGAE